VSLFREEGLQLGLRFLGIIEEARRLQEAVDRREVR
jgi:hypothetical protein